MNWMLNNPQIHSTFAALGKSQGDEYVVSDECRAILQEIMYKLSVEDHTLRTYRRAIGFGQNIKNDIIPLLVNATDEDILNQTIRLLVNLTVPVECLLSVDVMSRTEIGRHTLFELNNLLISAKEAFSEVRSTKAVIDQLTNILEKETKLSIQQCDNVNNCLLLLRNLLHISETNYTGTTSLQNQIIWNLFTQSIDKLLLHLMTCPQRTYWGVTLVQLIALLYKDQHVSTLQKLLNVWVEGSMSESSDDNESNTSPPKQCSGGSSPMLTSDPTSDSSDTGSGNGSKSCGSQMSEEMTRMDFQSSIIRVKPFTKQTSIATEGSDDMSDQRRSSGFSSFDGQSQHSSEDLKALEGNNMASTCSSSTTSTASKTKKFEQTAQMIIKNNKKAPSSKQDMSDCGYGTQVENQETISTSSNEDDFPNQKVHQKPPPNQKQRYNATNKRITLQDKKELRRKKLVKRSRSGIISMKGIMHHSPTDEDISNVLKEFTVDFLLKGYGLLVKELHTQLMNNTALQIDTSHFFWLITYFLKFAAQLELDLEHIGSVLCYEVLSYLTFEGVNLCEQIQLDAKVPGTDLRPSLRRMHLVITAIREFIQALDVYKKSTHLNEADKKYLKVLRAEVAHTNDLRCMFVLLLRTYVPTLHNQQYLQDLVTTNHQLLLLIDDVAKMAVIKSEIKDGTMEDHIKQFATVDIMHQYGLLLENFRENGEFVNDCIFTMMHHVSGDLGQASILFQPGILKTYSSIWESEYEICDDWSDLIEYVIHKFINTPQQAPLSLPTPIIVQPIVSMVESNRIQWTKEEMDTLYWYYIQSKSQSDVVGSIIRLFEENGNKNKPRIAVVQQLLKQDIISLAEFDDLMVFEDSEYVRTANPSTPSTVEAGMSVSDDAKPVDDIKILKDRLLKENKGMLVEWLQKVLIECCFIKLKLNPPNIETPADECIIMEPIPHHCILKNQSIPLVPWNSDQHLNLIYQPFVLLLHKLGFHLPDDTNRLWVRIPNFWTAEILFTVAAKLGPIDESFLKFDPNCLNMSMLVLSNNNKDNQSDTSGSQVEQFCVPKLHKPSSLIRYTPDPTPSTLPSWLETIIRAKETTLDGLLPYDCHPPEEQTLNSEQMSILLGGCLLSSSVDIPTTITNLHLNSTNSVTRSAHSGLDISICRSDLEMIVESTVDELPQQEDVNVVPNIDRESDKKQCLKVVTDTLVLETLIEEPEALSVCDTASMTSNLTRMYVSDEEEKHHSQIMSSDI